MKRSLLITFALFLILPHIARAQTPVVIEGLQTIAERQYAVDTEGTIDIGGDGLFLVSSRVYVFDSADNAENTWETLVTAESVESDLPEDDDSITYEKIELHDVGDRAVVLSLSAELSDSETGVFRTVIVQKNATIVTVTAIAGSVDAATVADDIATAMIERDSGDDEVIFDGTGASTGGVWDIFLPADADELADLHAYADKETQPAQ